MKNLVAVMLTLAAVLAPLTLHAQDVTTSQMQRIANRADARGFTLTRQYYRGSLNRGQYQEFTFELSDVRDQFVVAVCDGDCRDVDVTILETNGREIAADRAYDDQPAVMVPAGHPGTHRVRVSMPQCNINPCRYELALFSR